VNLVKGQGPSIVVPKAPATTEYSAFTGALGLIVGLIGVAALFIESLTGVITWGLDALAAVCLLAGGIAVAVGLRGTDCSDFATIYNNELLDCGWVKIKGEPQGPFCTQNQITSRCKMDKADDAFMFMAFVLFGASIVVSIMSGRRAGRSGFV
jgi:hypothetical protein